jgi:hypothetical protein
MVFERSLCWRKCGVVVQLTEPRWSGSKRRVESEELMGDEGAEKSFSEDVRPSRLDL